MGFKRIVRVREFGKCESHAEWSRLGLSDESRAGEGTPQRKPQPLGNVAKKGTFAVTFHKPNTEMIRKFAVLATMAAFIVACGGNAEETMDKAANDMENAADKAGDMIDDAANDMKEAGEDMMDKAGEAVDSAAAAGEQMMDEAGEAMDNATEEAKEAMGH